MAGKQYLVDLSRAGFPVIPTVDRAADLGLLPRSAGYVVKPKLGADSVGLRFTDEPEHPEGAGDTLLVQPRIDFRYEVSFYFVGHDFQYALHAPHPERRWVLEPYSPSAADLDFARRFVEWNTLTHGIQRVDACRTAEGGTAARRAGGPQSVSVARPCHGRGPRGIRGPDEGLRTGAAGLTRPAAPACVGQGRV